MKNIKVAFILEFSDGWIGGINYYKNLLSAFLNEKLTENAAKEIY